MKCCNPRCCANWIYTTCYSSTFTSAGFSPPLVILVISPSSSISVHPGFFPTIRPIPCIFAYFIIYGTIVHGGEFCEFQHVEETYLEECYDLRANEVDSFAFFFTSSSPLLFFNYSLQPRYSDLFSALLPFIAPLLATLPVCFRRKQARGKSLPLKVRSSFARETLLDRRIHARECKKFDGSWMLRQQGKSITRTIERCCWPRLNTPITRIDSYKSINTFHSINNFGKMIWPPCSELAQRNAVYSIEVKKKKRNKKRRKV